MTFSSLLRMSVAGTLAAIVLLLQSSCATGTDEGVMEEILIDGDSTTIALEQCVETKCPGPLVTCAGEGAPCTNDLRSDVDHCGSCEPPCPKGTITTHGTYLCSDSQCKIACDALYADCNNDAKDSCETRTSADPQNC